jgi:hypothetical protein
MQVGNDHCQWELLLPLRQRNYLLVVVLGSLEKGMPLQATTISAFRGVSSVVRVGSHTQGCVVRDLKRAINVAEKAISLESVHN